MLKYRLVIARPFRKIVRVAEVDAQTSRWEPENIGDK